MEIICLLILQFFALAISASPTVYLIRHGEKPADGGNGLNAEGEQRAQCLRKVFGLDSGYNIGKIIAQKPKKSGKRARPFLTVLPLSMDLHLKVDTRCDRDDKDCAAALVEAFDTPDHEGQNILICWEHKALSNIVGALGNPNPPQYPKRFDVIWTNPYPYTEITASTSEHCEGLDSNATGLVEL